MTIQEALIIIEKVLDQGRLNKVQDIVFHQCWEGKSYQEIATSSDYDAGYLKDTGSQLWQSLSKAFGERVSKNNLQLVFKRHSHLLGEESPQIQIAHKPIAPRRPIAKQGKDWGEAIDASILYDCVEELARW